MNDQKTVRVKLTCGRAGHRTESHPVLGPDGRPLFDPRTGQPRVDTVVTGYFSQSAGDVVEMPEGEAQRHLERGLAVAVRDEAPQQPGRAK